MAQIGIKLADHSFYPVLEDDSPQRKRMVLTVAREGQHSVQIDLLRRSETGDQLVGCLVLEDLPGETDTELEFVLGLDGSGNIDARISDSSGSQYQCLAANLSQLDLPSAYGLPEETSDVADISGMESLDDDLPGDDFLPDLDLPEEFDGEARVHASISDNLAEADFQDYDEDGDAEADSIDDARPVNAVLLLALILIVLGLVLVGAYFFFTILRGEALPELPGTAAILSLSVAYLPG